MRKGEKLHNKFREWALMHYQEGNKDREIDYLAELMIITPLIAQNLRDISDKEFDEILGSL